ncbi:MAG TPA: hypothetical protein PK349_10820 [Candidatus Hydrogenedentes bacterium]|nr:hypothetical protein [Candidatus Hydrogenedentota bacterium]
MFYPHKKNAAVNPNVLNMCMCYRRWGGGTRSHSERTVRTQICFIPGMTLVSLPMLFNLKQVTQQEFQNFLTDFRRKPDGGLDSEALQRFWCLNPMDHRGFEQDDPDEMLHQLGVTREKAIEVFSLQRGFRLAAPVKLDQLLLHGRLSISKIPYCADPAVCIAILSRAHGMFLVADREPDFSFSTLWRSVLVDDMRHIPTLSLEIPVEKNQV